MRALPFCVAALTFAHCAVAQTAPPTQPPVKPATTNSVTAQIDVDPDDLLAKPVAANWLMYNGDYTGRRFSSLNQITPENVAQLRAQWVFHIPRASELEVTPVVVDGVMFVTAQNDAYAVDARTGRQIWHHTMPISEGLIDDASQHHNRGVAVVNSDIYMETDNAHLLRLDARSGHLIWDVPYAEGNHNYGATSAPLIVKDKVLVGTSGGDDGVRGFISAFDVDTGKLAWNSGPFPAPANRARKVGRAIFICAAAAPRGCPAATIPT